MKDVPIDRARASTEVLEELGWLTIQWSRLEACVDLLAAYLHYQDTTKTLPRPFNARVKFVKSELDHPAFLNLRDDGLRVLADAMAASRQRNDLVHGIVTHWHEEAGALHTILRSTPKGYLAIQDISVTLTDLERMSKNLRSITARLFGLLERLKSTLRFLSGDDRFQDVARLEGDRD